MLLDLVPFRDASVSDDINQAPRSHFKHLILSLCSSKDAERENKYTSALLAERHYTKGTFLNNE